MEPILFNCYIADLFFQLEQRFPTLSFHSYAGDIQIWLDFSPSSPEAQRQCRVIMAEVIGFIQCLMGANFLRLNTNKTVFLPISNKFEHTSFDPLSLSDGSEIEPSKQVRNLGFIFYSNFGVDKQISSIRSSAFHQLRRLQVASKYRPDEHLPSVVMHLLQLAWTFVIACILICLILN